MTKRSPTYGLSLKNSSRDITGGMLAAAVTSLTHPSATEVETAGLLQEFRATLHKISSREAVEAQLKAAFQVPALHESCNNTMFGSVRASDSIIAVEKASRIAARKPGEPMIESLEVAAGGSFGGRDSDFGCPFTARAEAAAWRGKINSTLTDYNYLSGCTILFEREGKLEIERAQHFIIRDSRLFSHIHPLPSGGAQIDPVSLSELRKLYGKESEYQIDKIRSQLWIFRDFRWEDSDRTWVLPNLSPDYERILYGMPETRGNVSFFNLSEHLTGRKFDIITGRHIPRMYDDQIAIIREQVVGALKPGGWAYLTVERQRGPDCLLEIGTRLSTPEASARFSLE